MHLRVDHIYVYLGFCRAKFLCRFVVNTGARSSACKDKYVYVLKSIKDRKKYIQIMRCVVFIVRDKICKPECCNSPTLRQGKCSKRRLIKDTHCYVTKKKECTVRREYATRRDIVASPQNGREKKPSQTNTKLFRFRRCSKDHQNTRQCETKSGQRRGSGCRCNDRGSRRSHAILQLGQGHIFRVVAAETTALHILLRPEHSGFTLVHVDFQGAILVRRVDFAVEDFHDFGAGVVTVTHIHCVGATV